MSTNRLPPEEMTPRVTDEQARIVLASAATATGDDERFAWYQDADLFPAVWPDEFAAMHALAADLLDARAALRECVGILTNQSTWLAATATLLYQYPRASGPEGRVIVDTIEGAKAWVSDAAPAIARAREVAK